MFRAVGRGRRHRIFHFLTRRRSADPFVGQAANIGFTQIGTRGFVCRDDFGRSARRGRSLPVPAIVIVILGFVRMGIDSLSQPEKNLKPNTESG